MDHGDQMEEKGIGFGGRREKKEKETKGETMTEEGEKVRSLPAEPTKQGDFRSGLQSPPINVLN